MEKYSSYVKSRKYSIIKPFNFLEGNKIISIIGSMGTGKTEYCAKIYKDSLTLRDKKITTENFIFKGYDKTRVFYLKNINDVDRFKYPNNSISFRNNYVEIDKEDFAIVSKYKEIENIFKNNFIHGTFIIDETCFYDEKLISIIKKEAKKRQGIIICSSINLNFRREVFNNTMKLLLKNTDETILLETYCNYKNCISNASYSYRYYKIEDNFAPALYFDPLVIIDKGSEIFYSSVCKDHHILPAKEYSHNQLLDILKNKQLSQELYHIKNNIKNSILFKSIEKKYLSLKDKELIFNSMNIKYLSERILNYLFFELNLINEEFFIKIVKDLDLNEEFFIK